MVNKIQMKLLLKQIESEYKEHKKYMLELNKRKVPDMAYAREIRFYIINKLNIRLSESLLADIMSAYPQNFSPEICDKYDLMVDMYIKG